MAAAWGRSPHQIRQVPMMPHETIKVEEMTSRCMRTPHRTRRTRSGLSLSQGRDSTSASTRIRTERVFLKSTARTRSSKTRSSCWVRRRRSRNLWLLGQGISIRWCMPMDRVSIRKSARSIRLGFSLGLIVNTFTRRWTRRTLAQTASKSTFRFVGSELRGFLPKSGLSCALPSADSYRAPKTTRKGDSSSLKNSFEKSDRNCTSSGPFSAT